jgi:hypothetical protein
MPTKSKKPERPMFGSFLDGRLKKAAPEWARNTNQKNAPESVSKGKSSTKSFARKKAGR